MTAHMRIKEQDLQQKKNSHITQIRPDGIKRVQESDDENPGLGRIFAVVRRKVAVIASVAVIVTTAAAAWTVTRTPKYEGKFQLLVEPLKTTESELLVLLSETLKQNVNEITKQNRTELDYQALMEVLKSPKVISPVVQELQNKYPDISYDQLVGYDTSGKAAVGREGTLQITRIIKGKDESRVIEVRYRASSPRKIQFVLDRVSQAYRNYSIEQQQTNLSQGVKFVDQQIPKLRLRVNTLQGQLQAFQQQYEIFNPELQGEQLLTRADQLLAQRRETEKQLAEVKSLYISLQKQLGMSQDTAIAASALSESPQYQQLLTRAQEIEAKIATESARFREDSPVIQSLRDQLNKLQPLLEREARLAQGNTALNKPRTSAVGAFQNTVRRDLIQQLADSANQIKLLESSLLATKKTQEQINRQIQQYPVVSRQYSNLERELKVATDTLNQLLAKKEALRVDAAQQDLPWDLIMPPTIPRDEKGNFIAISPDRKRDVVLGGVAGVLLGILAAFLIENSENVFYDPDQMKRKTKLPMLGVIPYQKEIKKYPTANLVNITPQDKKQKSENGDEYREYVISPVSQAFCSLYNRVRAYEAPIRSIVVTSSSSGEGKSTVAANLAKIAAQAGMRVLLVDADVRYPQIHKILGLVNTQGFSEVLSQGLNLDDVIGQAPAEENLFVVTAGDAPFNPTKLFSSQRLETFVDFAQAKYDLVVYDTPPILGLLDTNFLATHTDGILLVVGLGKTDRSSVDKALEELKAGRVPVLGTVANTVHAN